MVIEAAFSELSSSGMRTLFGDEFPSWDVEHAAVLEASLMLHLEPEPFDRAVDDQATRHPLYDVVPAPRDFVPASGALWKATRASVERARPPGRRSFPGSCRRSQPNWIAASCRRPHPNRTEDPGRRALKPALLPAWDRTPTADDLVAPLWRHRRVRAWTVAVRGRLSAPERNGPAGVPDGYAQPLPPLLLMSWPSVPWLSY